MVKHPQFRPINKEKEIVRPLKLKYKKEAENTSVEVEKNKIYELEPMNEKMLFRPDFRGVNKKKWQANQLKFNQSTKNWKVTKNS